MSEQVNSLEIVPALVDGFKVVYQDQDIINEVLAEHGLIFEK
jgi:hypothetical protein